MSRSNSIRGSLPLSILLVATGCKTAPPPRQAPPTVPSATLPAPTRTPISEEEKQRRRVEKEAQKSAEHRRRLATVNVTFNPDVVRRCQRLKAFDETEQAERARDVRIVIDTLKQDVIWAGGNTLLLSADGLHGEAYLCEAVKP